MYAAQERKARKGPQTAERSISHPPSVFSAFLCNIRALWQFDRRM